MSPANNSQWRADGCSGAVALALKLFGVAGYCVEFQGELVRGDARVGRLLELALLFAPADRQAWEGSLCLFRLANCVAFIPRTPTPTLEIALIGFLHQRLAIVSVMTET
jgi:hypothetical protein